MPDGFSPELKRAPDTLKGSSLREKPHKLKKEAAPNIPRHPSETFPWLPKEEYFRQRDEYLPTMIPVVEQAIANDPQFKYKDDSEITKTVATLFSRAFFTSKYLCNNTPQEHEHETPIHIMPASYFVDSNIGAQAGGVFELGGQIIEDWINVPPSQIDQIKLKYAYIDFNTNRLGKHVEIIQNVAIEELIEKGLPVDFAEQWKAEQFDEEGIEQEIMMIHETAHVFYIINAASNPESMRRYIEERKKYPKLPPDTDEGMTEEELCQYTDAPIEQDAHKWEVAFMQPIFRRWHKWDIIK